MSGKSEVNDDDTGSPRQSLVITQKHIDDIIAGAARPTTPPLEDTNVDGNANSDCGIPFCPKHGIQNRAMRRKMSAPIDVTRRKSGSIVLERKGSAPAMPQLMLMGDDNDNVRQNARTVQDAKSVKSDEPATDAVCIRNAQRKRMKRLSRIESDKQMQRNYDDVRKELKRKLSDPNPMKAVETTD